MCMYELFKLWPAAGRRGCMCLCVCRNASLRVCLYTAYSRPYGVFYNVVSIGKVPLMRAGAQTGEDC